METKAKSTEQVLRLTRRFSAPREKVFAAWTNPESLKKWLGLACGTVEEVEIDLRIGGAYRVRWKEKDGNLSEVSGQYRELKLPERLAFTWEDTKLGTGETVVTLEFRDLGGSTELELTHRGFPNTKIKEAHDFGWTTSLNDLKRVIE